MNGWRGTLGADTGLGTAGAPKYDCTCASSAGFCGIGVTAADGAAPTVTKSVPSAHGTQRILRCLKRQTAAPIVTPPLYPAATALQQGQQLDPPLAALAPQPEPTLPGDELERRQGQQFLGHL